MKSNLSRTVLVIIMALFISWPVGASAAYEFSTMPNVKTEMLNAEYWISKMNDPDKVIMSASEVESFNRDIVKDMPGSVFDLPAYPTYVTASKLNLLINQSFPKEPCYLNGKEVDATFWAELKKRINIAGIEDKQQVEYAFTVKRSNIKIFPTTEIIGDEADDPAFDLFQDSSILPAEPLVVLHHSADRSWYFVQMYNCTGWVPAVDIALCDRDTWLKYQREKDFIIVTANRLRLDANPLSPETSELEFTMGCKLPILETSELKGSLDMRVPHGNYLLKLPVRNEDGELEFKMTPLPVSNDVVEGYLPYTRANIIRQAFKMQGDRYCWGGMLGGRDCSSLVMELYRCFGFRLARNSDAQEISTGKTFSFKNHSTAYRETLLQNVLPGASLHFPGHEMLYLGEDGGRYYVINALGNYAQPQPGQTKLESIRVRSVVVNELSVQRANGKQWLEQLTSAKQLEKSSFTDLQDHPDRLIIEKLADQGIVKGKNDNRFDPDGIVTRAEFAVMLCHYLNLEPDAALAANSFTDLKDDWYAGPVGGLLRSGIITNPGDARFNPQEPLTRSSIAVLLSRLPQNGVNTVAKDQSNPLQAYSDYKNVPEWAYGGLVFALTNGVISTQGFDLIAPADSVSRAEAAVALYRMSGLKDSRPSD